MFNDDQYYGDYDSFFEYKINTVLSFLGLRSQLASKAEPEQRQLEEGEDAFRSPRWYSAHSF